MTSATRTSLAMTLRCYAALLLLFPLAVVPTFGQTVTTITDGFGGSGDVAIGPDGNAYVADFGVTLSNANGTTVYRVTPEGERTVFATGLAGASGNEFDPDGNLFQSNIAGSRVSRITPDGTVSTYATAGIVAPVGVTVDADGNVYNTNCQTPGRISRTTPDGTTTTFASSSLMSCPNGLTIDDDGNLYTANFNNGRVIKIMPDGTPSLFVTVNPLRGNGHITFANGRLYVCNWSGRIYEVMLDGQVRVLAGTGALGTNDGPANEATFFRPNGIAASVTGDTLFINQSTNVVPASDPTLHPNVVRMITGVLQTVDAEGNPSEADGLSLAPTVPNPFRQTTTLTYTVPALTKVRLRVHDVLGRTVRTLVDRVEPAGEHTVTWDGRDDQARRLTAGVYLIVFDGANRRRVVRRVTLVR